MPINFTLQPESLSYLRQLGECPQADPEARTLAKSISASHTSENGSSTVPTTLHYKTLLAVYRGRCECHPFHLHDLVRGSTPTFASRIPTGNALLPPSDPGHGTVDTSRDVDMSDVRQRVAYLRTRSDNKAYRAMVRNVLPPVTYADLNPKFVSNDIYVVANYIFTVVGVYVFAFAAYALFYERSIVAQLLFGLVCASLVAAAEFYILAKMDYL